MCSVRSGTRKQLHTGPSAALKCRVEDIAVPANPVKACRSSGKKGLAKQLLRDNRLDPKQKMPPANSFGLKASTLPALRSDKAGF